MAGDAKYRPSPLITHRRMDARIASILQRFPFLCYGTMNGEDYLGVTQNCDAQMISIYLLDLIPTAAERERFLALANEWWWGSNRQVPINLFLKDRWQFRGCLRHFPRRDFSIEAGPTVSLQDTITRRVRKRQITLVRRVPAGHVPAGA